MICLRSSPTEATVVDLFALVVFPHVQAYDDDPEEHMFQMGGSTTNHPELVVVPCTCQYLSVCDACFCFK